jgi:hypothetical protein
MTDPSNYTDKAIENMDIRTSIKNITHMILRGEIKSKTQKIPVKYHRKTILFEK